MTVTEESSTHFTGLKKQERGKMGFEVLGSLGCFSWSRLDQGKLLWQASDTVSPLLPDYSGKTAA